MGAVTAGVSRKGRRPGRRKLAWITIGVVIVGLLGAYLKVAVFSQPLVSGYEDGTGGGKLVVPPPESFDQQSQWVFEYVDGRADTFVNWVENGGPVGLTITGVESSPDYWVGILTIADSRAGVVSGPDQIDERATWATPTFRPIHLDPGQRAPIAVHVVTAHCEDTSPGGTMSTNFLAVRFSVLGFPRVQDVLLNAAIAVPSPNTCPRSGPARPTG